jgi:hypothetical protein
MEVQGYPVFQILIADIDRDSIIANIAYAEVGLEIWGCYSGYAGGGVVDFRYFYFDADYNPLITDDFLVLTTEKSMAEVNTVFTELESVRARLESEAEDVLSMSEAGHQFLDDCVIDHVNGIRSRLSPEATEDIIYDLQDEWTLTFRLE